MVRKIVAAVAALAFAGLVPNTTYGQLQAGDKVAIIGDSITEQKLYSVYIEDYLVMCKPAAGVTAMQFGWSGETSWGFLARMQNDAIYFAPTVATTCYGMNDGGYGPLTEERSNHYRDSMHGIVQGLKKAGVHFIVVGAPGCVDSDTFRTNEAKHQELAETYNKTLGQLRELARQVATEEGVAFADTYGVMMDAMKKTKEKYGAAYPFAGGDGVHPGPNGHIAMAYAFLKGLGVSGDIGTITLDMSSGQATASEGHKVLAAAGGSVDIESTRYPFCFYGEEKSPGATAGVAAALPFNQDLNRMILKVSNANGEKMKVTWGKQSKEFATADLAKGINLAAEFGENPFSEAFKAVEETIKHQQNYETPMVKDLMHSMPRYRELVPTAAPQFEGVQSEAKKKDDQLMQSSIAAVKPVRHTIKVEAVK